MGTMTEELSTGVTPCNSGLYRADLWFGNGDAAAQAKRLCQTCPIKEQCAEMGWDHTEGIYGGLSGPDRYRLDRDRFNATRARIAREQTATDRAIKLARVAAENPERARDTALMAARRATAPKRETTPEEREIARIKRADWVARNRERNAEYHKRYRDAKRAEREYVKALIASEVKGEKACTQCGVVKPLTMFRADTRRSDGRRAACRACLKGYDATYAATRRAA